MYQLYKNRIGESGFHKIWNGDTWKGIMDEVYTKEQEETSDIEENAQVTDSYGMNFNTLLNFFYCI